MKHKFNRDILMNLVMKKLKRKLSNNNLPCNSKIILISKVITTDIISSFQVLSYFKNDRVYCLKDILDTLKEADFPCASMKSFDKDKLKVNFSIYEADMIKKYKEADQLIYIKKNAIDSVK